MAILMTLVGAGMILLVLWEGFETIVLPRRVTRRFRLTRVFYRATWRTWTTLVDAVIPPARRESWLSYFGPLSLLLLLSVWAAALIAGFALVHWAGATLLYGTSKTDFLTDFYLSGTTFFTLGLGDVVPHNPFGRLLVIVESGMGFAFLALVISYLPALNQSFARREVSISLLDARAGSPPTASEMLRRHSHERGRESLRELLHEWERWAAEFLEGHLSYPVLAYFRSQHDNQSWLAALTAILDTCALIMAGVEGTCERQAELTFGMSRHAVVDLSLVFQTRPREALQDRLSAQDFEAMRELLIRSGHSLKEEHLFKTRLTELRQMYEPYVAALSNHFQVKLPPWLDPEQGRDNWQVSYWQQAAKGRADSGERGRHF